MPLEIRTESGSAAISLNGEMTERDFGGPSKYDWYYATFEGLNTFYDHDPKFKLLKEALSGWVSDQRNVSGPYYIHEDYESGAFGNLRFTLSVIMLDPRDILVFQQAWSEHFKFQPEDAQKNLRMDVQRIEKGFLPENERLQDIYARYRAVDSASLTAQAKIDKLIATFTGVLPAQPTLRADQEIEAFPEPKF